MIYEVKLDAFEGPLDLLLHLIKKYEIDIYDISMKHLTEQYFHYINSMTALDINVQGEYLVMASELLRIKSRMLLPDHSVEEEVEDPRESLVHQLLEYQNYKYYAALLEEKREDRSRMFVKSPNDLSPFEQVDDQPMELSIVDLMAAYQKAKDRVKLKPVPVLQVEREHYSIQQAEMDIQSVMKKKENCSFTDLLTFNETRHRLVTLFMALLEMAKNQYLIIEQQHTFDDITLRRGELWKPSIN